MVGRLDDARGRDRFQHENGSRSGYRREPVPMRRVRGGDPRGSRADSPTGRRTLRQDRGPETEGSDSSGNGMERWAEKNRGVLFVVIVACVAMIIVLAGIQMWANDDDEDSAETFSITEFHSGSSNVLVNTTYLGNDAYIRVPWNATIKEAKLDLSGAKPPGIYGYETGRNPSDLDVADLNQDLIPDVVSISYEENTFDIIYNNGDMTMTRGKSIEIGKAPIRLELTDLNDDGYPDALVLCEDSRELLVLINDQIGGFVFRGEPFNLPTLPSDLQVFDVENDGDVDAVVSTINDDNLTIYLNDGSGNLMESSKILTEGNPTRMAVGDMDNDGLDDIVLSNRRDLDETIYSVEREKDVNWFNSISVLKNMGDGTFTKMVDDIRSQKGISSIGLGDLNSDGYQDIVMSNLGYHNVSLVLSDGYGDFLRGSMDELDVEELTSMDPIQVSLADLDADGDLDIWALTKSADSVLYYANDGNGEFLDPIQSYVGVNPTSMDWLDFDGDGDLDIVTSDWKAWDHLYQGEGSISVLLNLRDGIFRTYRQYETGNSPRGVFAGDIDKDGDIDISTANYFGSTVSILENDGLGRFHQDREYPIGLEPYAVVMEDFDNDGFVDGASADEANFRIVLLRSDQDGGFTTDRYLYDIGAYPFSLRTQDIDNDGDMDLFTSNYFQNSTTLMFNDGSGDFDLMFRETKTIYLENHMPYDSLMEDINGDGLIDLITVNRGNTIDPSDTISVMLNDGMFSFDEIVDYTVGKEPTSATLFDMDNDGDLDISTTNTQDDTITVLLNDGNGVFQYFDEYFVGDSPLYINSIDIDDDGWPDLAVSSSASNSLTFMRNEEGMGFVQFNNLNFGSFPYAIALSDLNSDGREDIILTAVNTNSVIVSGCYYYPVDIGLNVGIDGDIDFEYEGTLTTETSVEVEITDQLRRYVEDHRVEGKDILVPLRIISQEEGVVSLSDLLVVYSLD